MARATQRITQAQRRVLANRHSDADLALALGISGRLGELANYWGRHLVRLDVSRGKGAQAYMRAYQTIVNELYESFYGDGVNDGQMEVRRCALAQKSLTLSKINPQVSAVIEGIMDHFIGVGSKSGDAAVPPPVTPTAAAARTKHGRVLTFPHSA